MYGQQLRGIYPKGPGAGCGGDCQISTKSLHDAEGPLRGNSPLRGEEAQDRGDRSESMVAG